MGPKSLRIVLVCNVLLMGFSMATALSFDTNFVELDASKMISTSDSNYAISTPSFPSNWRSASVNGDEVTIATKDKQFIIKRYHALSAEEKTSLETIKNTLMNIVKSGPFNAKSQTGLSKITTFDRNGGSSSMGSGGSSSASSSSSGGISISRTGPNSFIVTKPKMPFKWQRVFFNDDVATIVYTDGRVVMLPQELMRQEEKSKLADLRKEVEKSSKAAESVANSMSKSFKNPMDFVNKALGGIFGR